MFVVLFVSCVIEKSAKNKNNSLVAVNKKRRRKGLLHLQLFAVEILSQARAPLLRFTSRANINTDDY